jgi:hypothetical protein
MTLLMEWGERLVLVPCLGLLAIGVGIIIVGWRVSERENNPDALAIGCILGGGIAAIGLGLTFIVLVPAMDPILNIVAPR